MTQKKLKFILNLSLILGSTLLLSACGKKTVAPQDTPTPTPKMVEMDASQKPYISLTPRADGHELKLKIVNIPDSITQIEYELIYLATDGNIEIEKGVGDTLKIESSSLEKDILLGTASCTNACKYKYDEGITGGTLSLIFINRNGQMSTHETKFVLTDSNQINQNKTLSLSDLTIKATAAKGQYFLLLKNYGFPNSSVQSGQIYSVFASGNGAGTIDSIEPSSATKENQKSLAGDYLIGP
ncbi:hypothetical protein KJ909_01395 [Patescibacteria group bacterium]|nr:hypothetical protein [Patescibacteria group bacterium]